MANQRLIALNNNAGAYVNIVATVFARLIEMKEDESVATQGLQMTSVVDNFGAVNTFAFASEPVEIPDPLAYPLKGRVQGFPAQGQAGAFNAMAATTLASVRSNGNAGTTLRFIEYE